MILFHLEYTINPGLAGVFRTYASQFVKLTEKYGGRHFGYFIDSKSDEKTAVAMFAFESIDQYDVYRKKVLFDPEYEEAMALAKASRCIKTCCRTVYDRQVA